MAKQWDYNEYKYRLLGGNLDADFLREVTAPLKERGGVWSNFDDRVINIHKELEAQKKIPLDGGKTLGDQWYGGDIGKDDATWDMAFRLAETGVGSLYDIGQRQVEREVSDEGATWTQIEPELFNKKTGEALTNFNRESGTFDTTYNLQFTPDGVPIAYTGNKRSDWVKFRDDALRPAIQMVGSLIPVVGPYVAAANAAYAASKGDWGKAILSALPAAAKIAGQFGVAADTISTINEANKYAKILKSLEDKNLLSAAFQGADLAGITELGDFDLNDVKKAVNLGMAIKNEDPMALVRAGMAYAPKDVYGHDPSMLKEGSFRYNDVFDPKTAGLVDLSEQPIEGYEFTKDFTTGADLDLFPSTGGPGIKAPPVETDAFRPDGSVNYDLFDFEGYVGAPRFRMPTAPNLESMGGGQGFVMPVDGGVMTESGFIPDGYTPDLGDPSSFINKPPPGEDVSPAVQKALDAGAAQTAKDVRNAGQQKPKTPQQPGSGLDFAGLLGLLGGMGTQQGPIPLTVPDNAADIKLMEEIFGTSLSAPSTGNETDKATALARLLRS